MSFKTYLNEGKIEGYILDESLQKRLDEVLITFGNRPKFNQVVLLAGGAGSGKGFMSNKLLGIEGRVFDVDQVKSQIIHPGTPKLNKKVLDKYGVDVTKMDLRNPDEVALLHKINDEMGISKKKQKLFFQDLERLQKKQMLPNVIFDTTMKSEKKIKTLVDTVTAAGYKRENIHIIWIMTPAKIAKKQNLERERIVPEEILMDTHRGVADTMYKLMKNASFQDHIDGYVYVMFNQAFVDNTLVFSEFGGSYVEDAMIIELKRPGKKPMSFSDIATNFLRKIKKYVPKEVRQNWGKF